MTATAVPGAGAAADARPPRATSGVDHWAGVVEAWLRMHTVLVYAFLYVPVVIVVLFSFNDNGTATIWTGFSTRWYEIALGDELVLGYLENSFLVAMPSAILATAFGTMAALGLQRVPKRIRIGFDSVTYISIIVPEVVIALATLVMFASAFQVIEAATGIRMNLGIPTIIAAHMLFNISVVLLLVRARLSGLDRTQVEASFDLFATPWRTFRQITFPQLLPAIVAGFLLSFTFSFDDFVITSFVSGPGSSTLPLFIWGQVRKGVTPETNAVATMMLVVTLALLVLGQFVLSRQSRRQGGTGSMAGIIVDQT